ncbi:MAG: hypothetical protein ACM30H_02650 [Clostridia bacterium]
MQTKILLAIAVAAALVAACDRNAPKAGSAAQPSPNAGTSQISGAPTNSGVQSSVTPSTSSQPSLDQKREGANPQQGQVDPKDRDQHRDFQQSGDAKGPRSADTTPRN